MILTQLVYYAALVLLGVGFFFPTIIWLRWLAIAGSAAIVLHGLMTPDYVAAILGVALAGINAWRLFEVRRLVGATREATAASGAPINMDWLLPHMETVALPKDTVLFHKDSAADAMYFISHGRVRFEEVDVEMGIFSHDKRRTATAKVMEDSSLLRISAERVRELYHQNPEFGFFIIDVITRRLMDDAAAGKLKP
jgi:CRP/FNR family transcriptional regulator, cyclic AMP receptor protein